MGEVYRAKDTRLGRDVAIKVLAAHLSENAEVRARFEREARVISGLQHPDSRITTRSAGGGHGIRGEARRAELRGFASSRQ